MAFYLLIKEHLDTGLKYLCKHVAFSFSECENYKGSGTYWKRLQNDNEWRYLKLQ